MLLVIRLRLNIFDVEVWESMLLSSNIEIISAKATASYKSGHLFSFRKTLIMAYRKRAITLHCFGTLRCTVTVDSEFEIATMVVGSIFVIR